MEAFKKLAVLLKALMLMFFRATLVDAVQPWATTSWGNAHATFYGGNDASGTMGGACGYGNLYSRGYGTATTALSNGLFNNGLTCGACFTLVCKLDGSRWCYSGGKQITVTATNACPPGSEGGWCDPPRLHFDLSYPMFQKLAQPVGGVIPVRYKRVPCVKQGGIRMSLYGNPWFDYVLVHNVAGGGDVAAVSIKGSKTNWVVMHQNWGQYWSASSYLVGQALSFKVTLGNGKSIVFWDIAPKNWQFGQTYEADNNQNF
ncbi:expansin [Marchantia polymorpha subsp. ruderalis]|uniref:Expansin n=2 Tax=Marchantia polymorpha TaxID=3197 RepID=A0A176W9G4_MARPO|nr:hypothetical protein AXG93_509s1160 [Marchantia polymorpha subsp. ruderalis]PTQ37230.1 hypothetical protein MARPO_0058s0021 [Marchantia polymorpha]BBN12477.1 hypothetical protein Mp_5g20430 [Marchantia polymorpha subsp. ruderalis]|eukprot:PTQ37230.1 hypothetical protein MARPO_0058s0021 [Marchantia polymorpha]